ncbi:MAG: dephospho-CoA kinase [Deltaproteobacteria bacterium]|nr:dephospho-CoA kinase [Deltaproteobacteria bacterium]
MNTEQKKMISKTRKRFLTVGLTGGIASGKSSVSKIFRARGIPVICADELAREVVKPGSGGIKEITSAFGDSVLDVDGTLNRPELARIVFSDAAKRKTLESIIHPRVSREKERLAKEYMRKGHKIVVVDVPLLFEAGWETDFDLVILVYAPRKIQKKRLLQRDSISADEASSRLSAQMDIESKKTLADIVIDNSGSLADTEIQVSGIIDKLESLLKEEELSQTMSRRIQV